MEAALACLVTDRAIERVIDEEELHDALTTFLDEFAGGADAHVFRDGICAGDGGTWHPADGLVAVFIVNRILARGRAGWHSHLDKAHPAVSRNCELRMVAVVRNVDFYRAAGLDHAGAFGKLVPFTVNLHVHHAFFGGDVFWQFGVCCGRWGVAHGWERKFGSRVALAKYVDKARRRQVCFVKFFTRWNGIWGMG